MRVPGRIESSTTGGSSPPGGGSGGGWGKILLRAVLVCQGRERGLFMVLLQ